ncbi:hypothetical protein HT031_005118 [Scenedesmus sp. PABB004]|nr:hypothetical protein HT031_005118 [Scenedesmus sp. PABB004]
MRAPRVALAALLLLAGWGAAGAAGAAAAPVRPRAGLRSGDPRPLWHRAWSAEFNETTKLTALFTWTTTGAFHYDAESGRQLVTRANGRGDRYCKSVHPLTDTPCSHLVTGGQRYLIFPELRECCRCCSAEAGCGVLSPHWLDDAEFDGQVVAQGRLANRWAVRGLQPNTFTATADAAAVPLELDQLPNDFITFHAASFKPEPPPASAFDLPEFGCAERCPLTSVCTLFGRGGAAARRGVQAAAAAPRSTPPRAAPLERARQQQQRVRTQPSGGPRREPGMAEVRRSGPLDDTMAKAAACSEPTGAHSACCAGGPRKADGAGVAPAAPANRPGAAGGAEEADWLHAMLATTFFAPCAAHRDAKKNEATFFCADCGAAPTPLCCHCIGAHAGHRIIQIRRYVYCDVVRGCDISPHLDVSGVQTYIINQAKVMFLNQRPQSKMAAPGAPDGCVSCGRTLREGCTYCCLACKVDALVAAGRLAPSPPPGGAACAAAGDGSAAGSGAASDSGSDCWPAPRGGGACPGVCPAADGGSGDSDSSQLAGSASWGGDGRASGAAAAYARRHSDSDSERCTSGGSYCCRRKQASPRRSPLL